VEKDKVESVRRSQRIKKPNQEKGKAKKTAQEKVKPLKPNQGYIDGILGEENVEGKEHIIVHWEGFEPGNDTSSMSKAYAKKFPVLKKMLEDYEHTKHTDRRAEEKAPEKIEELRQVGPVADQREEALAPKINMAAFLGNYHGDGMRQVPVPHHIACWIGQI
jgi:hypothetical protein